MNITCCILGNIVHNYTPSAFNKIEWQETVRKAVVSRLGPYSQRIAA